MKHAPFIACLLGGCLSVPEGPTPQCATTADCNSGAGEVCEEGVCWGDPPEGTFAGTISPPNERGDLVPLELGSIALPPDGWFGDVVLERPVVFSGRVEAFCTAPADCGARTSIEATITITRPSQFAGGPGFRTVVTSEPDLATGLSFQVALPRSESPYTITIVPTDRYDHGLPSVLVPPLRTQLTINNDEIGVGKIYQLGEGPLHTIEGKVAAVGDELGLADYRVVALGRWDVNAPIGEVSTVAQTEADGLYRVVLSDGLVGPVEIVAAPIDDSVGPVLHMANIDPLATAPRNLMMPSSLGRQTTIDLLVKGGDGSGKIAPLAGARVKVSALVNPMGPTGPSNLYVTVASEVTTGSDGIARLDVFDGAAFAGMYRLRIVPPAGSSAVAVFNQPISLENQDTTLANRVAIGGVVVDSSGTPLGGVAVTVQPSLRFAWSLDDLPQGFLSEIPAATAVTTNTGEFVVFVDPIVADTWGSYDLVFVPKVESRAGNWIVADIAMPRDSATTSVMLDPISIPDAAFVHGRIVDPDLLRVEDAELKLFHVVAPTIALCTEVNNAPANCPIPAVLQGRGTSDGDGIVRLTLPRP